MFTGVLNRTLLISTIESLLTSFSFSRPLGNYFRSLIFSEGSDGVVSWDSACKQPISEDLNSYVKCWHLGYGDFSGSADMFADIAAHLNGQSVTLQSDPGTVAREKVVASIVSSGNKAVGKAFVFVRAASGAVTQIASTLSDASGRCVMFSPSTFVALRQNAGDEVYAWAPGYGLTKVDSRSMRRLSSGEYQINLSPDTSYTLPRNASLTINNGALTATSPSVTLSIACENATDMAVSEYGDTNAPVWEAYATSRSWTFSNTGSGEKYLTALFRNSSGTGAVASAEIVLAESGQTGGIEVSDDSGGANILLNGRIIEETTPATISGLAPGSYSISIAKESVSYAPAYQVVTVTAGATATASFASVTPTVPAYRFYSSGTTESTFTHLWTINETEKDVIMTWPSWQYEGIAWYALTNMPEGAVPLYRLYEPNIRRHLYTVNATEYVALEATSWNGEGVQYYVYAADTVSGLVPVYRFYHSANQNHHFTIDENEKDTIIATPDWGYTYEGIAFYVFSKKSSSVKGGIRSANRMSDLPDIQFRNVSLDLSGDYNGDGEEDQALYDEATGLWDIRASDGRMIIDGEQWGGPGFTPVAGDYDGDGRNDLCVYCVETGEWFVRDVDGNILLWPDGR